MAVASGLTALGVFTLISARQSSEAYAFVDQQPITRAEYERYAAVFTDPDGRLVVSPEQILQSLINQHLVDRAASDLGVTVDESHVRDAVAAAKGAIALGDPATDDAFEARVRMFELFKLVKARVATAPPIPEDLVEAAFESDPSLAVLTREEGLNIARSRLEKDGVERLWAAWLDAQRACSEIRIVSPSFGLTSSTPGPNCPPS